MKKFQFIGLILLILSACSPQPTPLPIPTFTPSPTVQALTSTARAFRHSGDSCGADHVHCRNTDSV